MGEPARMIGPFRDERCAVTVVVEAQLVHFVRMAQAVEIGMYYGRV
jgi:hypothetical protein